MSSAAVPLMTPLAARVAKVDQETHDTFTLTVEPGDGQPLAGFAPGQFSMLYVYGVGELPISISGDPHAPGRLVYTVRSVGRATHALVSRRPGEAVGVRGPFGRPWPLEAALGKDVLVVAGGIGLAPLRPVIFDVLRRRDDFVRLIVLYGARSPKDLLFRKQLAGWARQPDTQVLTTVDYGGTSWRGNVGVVTTLFRHLRLHPAQTVAYVCGPEMMMRFVVRQLEAREVPGSEIFLSMERSMKCAVGSCGHCQLGPHFVCKDGPVFSYDQLRPWMERHEL
jgi:NAD(P)H-flavin reductase